MSQSEDSSCLTITVNVSACFQKIGTWGAQLVSQAFTVWPGWVPPWLPMLAGCTVTHYEKWASAVSTIHPPAHLTCSSWTTVEPQFPALGTRWSSKIPSNPNHSMILWMLQRKIILVQILSSATWWSIPDNPTHSKRWQWISAIVCEVRIWHLPYVLCSFP